MKKKSWITLKSGRKKCQTSFYRSLFAFYEQLLKVRVVEKKKKKYVTISIGRAKKEKRTPGESESPILGLAEWVFLYFLKDFSQCTQFEVW